MSKNDTTLKEAIGGRHNNMGQLTVLLPGIIMCDAISPEKQKC